MRTKNTLFFLTCLAVCSAAYCQSSEHLVFKGVPIDGTLNQYVLRMEQKGFNNAGTENGTAVLNGEFAGYKDCTVGVSTLKQKDLVYKIAVVFPEKETWSTLSANYFDLKEMLAEKYGNPSEVVEKFDSSSPPRDDNTRMFKVKFDNCKYFSIWKTGKGQINLSIEHESVTRCYVQLSYTDKVNSNIIKAKAKSDL